MNIRKPFALLATALAPLVAMGALLRPAEAQNTLLILADDLGVDQLGSYGEGADPPPTVWIDLIASYGVRFSNAYADPSCSPTRAQIQTGRHGFRNGIGFIAHAGGPELPLAEITIPEALEKFAPSPFASALLGKWHLTNGQPGNNGPAHPLLQGYDHHAGSMASFDQGGQSYYAHTKFVDGVATFNTTYATTETVNDALAWIATAPEPWFCVVSFNAPHAPFDYPPPHLHSQFVPPGASEDELRISRYKAMIEAMDREIGRLITSLTLDQLLSTIFMFAGDNGTPQETVEPPFIPEHAKLSLHEGGCNVPLIIAGAAVPEQGAVCDALVEMTDLFPTILRLSGVNPKDFSSATGTTLDGHDLTPFLEDVNAPAVRNIAFSELFQPNGPTPLIQSYGVRDERYRLVFDGFKNGFGLYDLWVDPFEQTDLLLGGASPEVQGIFLDLRSQLIALTSS